MRNIIIVIAALMLNSTFVLASDKPLTSPDKVAAGEKLFATNCSTCHGPQGKGDGPAAMAFNPQPRNLQTEPFKGGTEDAKIFATISNGLTGSNMPGFAQLNETDRWNLAFFVKLLRKN